MSYRGTVGITVIALSVAVGPAWVQAADTAVDKAQSKTERAVDKVKEKGREATEAVGDSWLTAKVKIALAADERVKARQINVDTHDATVTLRGKVDSTEAKVAAEEITSGIEGVQGVRNDLQVVAPSQRAAVKADDKGISRQVKSRVSKDASLKKADIEVETNAGVVTLKGEVPTLTGSAHASELARQAPGVRAVKNDLSVKEK